MRLQRVPLPDLVQIANLLHQPVDWLFGMIEFLADLFDRPEALLVVEEAQYFLRQPVLGQGHSLIGALVSRLLELHETWLRDWIFKHCYANGSAMFISSCHFMLNLVFCQNLPSPLVNITNRLRLAVLGRSNNGIGQFALPSLTLALVLASASVDHIMAIHIIGISFVLKHAHEVDILSIFGVEPTPLLLDNFV